MVNISEDYKNLFRADSVQKHLRLRIEGITGYIENDKIYYESLSIKESIVSDSRWEFVGCIASEMKIKIQSDENFTKSDWNGARVRLEMACEDANGTIQDYIPLFKGKIDKCEKDADRLWQTLTCYDDLYSKFNSTYFSLKYSTVYQWYKSLFKNTKTVSLKKLRESFFDEFNIECILPDEGELPNDNLKIKKRFKSKSMTALDIVKGLCQINGCFGRLDRQGRFVFQYISTSEVIPVVGAYPHACYPNQVYPSQPLTETEISTVEIVDKYRSIQYDDAVIKPFARGITIRNNADDDGVYIADDSKHTIDWDYNEQDEPLISDDDEIVQANTYVLQGNMFAYKIRKKNKLKVGANILYAVGQDAVFRKYKAECNGLPYLECGDKIAFRKRDGSLIEFIITSRELKGIQSLTDTYTATVDKENSDYITSSQSVMNGLSNGITADDAVDISSDIVNNSLSGDTYSTTENPNLGYIYVVSFEDGVLTTSSGVPTNG